MRKPKCLKIQTDKGTRYWLDRLGTGWETKEELDGPITHVWHAHEWMKLPVPVVLKPGMGWVCRY